MGIFVCRAENIMNDVKYNSHGMTGSASFIVLSAQLFNLPKCHCYFIFDRVIVAIFRCCICYGNVVVTNNTKHNGHLVVTK